MDTIGIGDSYKPKEESPIEEYARGVMSFLDAMSIDRVSIVGHHTGGVVAVEVAAPYPERVDKLIVSYTDHVDAEDRERRKSWPPFGEVQGKEDGSHQPNSGRKGCRIIQKTGLTFSPAWLLTPLRMGRGWEKKGTKR